MSDRRGDPRPLPAASREQEPAALAGGDRSLRDMWSATQETLRERLDEPIERATRLTQRTLAWFPIRVWRHFLQHNGFLLAAGISYQSLFAIFGVIYLGFAAVGLWLGGSEGAVQGLIELINSYIPDLISEHGLVTPEQVTGVAEGSSGLLSITGAVAGVVVIWTAIGFITYTRRAVRDTFGLLFDRRNYFLLKARDLLAATLFGLALVVGAALGSITTGAIDLVFSLAGWDGDTWWTSVLTRVVSFAVAFALNSLALAAMFHFLTGTSLRWRRIWPGALLGGAAMVVLQIAAGFLFVYTPSNPLLATFAIFIGCLLWFRLNGIVILGAAAWIAVAAADRDEHLQSPQDLQAMEDAALLLAAEVRVRDARTELDRAPWYRRWVARQRLRRLTAELDVVRAKTPAAIVNPLQLD